MTNSLPVLSIDRLSAHPANRHFFDQLNAVSLELSSPERWLYVPYDQLTLALQPLDEGSTSREWGLVFIESGPWFRTRPYHKQRLAALIANQRLFAYECAQRGYSVRYHIHEAPIEVILAREIEHLGEISVREPAERSLRYALTPLLERGHLNVLPHLGWLSEPHDLTSSTKRNAPFRMDRFYRKIRLRTGILMEGKKPLGGQWSYDSQNRLPWRGSPPPPSPPSLPSETTSCELKRGSIRWIEDAFAKHPGMIRPELLPVSAKDTETIWSWVKQECMTSFGPYEDAMSMSSTGLFHSRLSTLINLHRILPHRVITEIEALEIPLSSKEGFIRQVLGWREFVYRVHRQTEGHRQTHDQEVIPVADQVGDAGYALWRGLPWVSEPCPEAVREDVCEEYLVSWDETLPKQRIEDGGALPNELDAREPLPAVFWGKPSGFKCLDEVIRSVWDEGWSHHITRLMVLCNWATSLKIDPRMLTDWFWIAYADAFDWVVEPNVLGMGTFALGETMTTKPYISGAAYLNKMSDYCSQCSFNPQKNCPLTGLYWNLLGDQSHKLSSNPRLSLPLASLRKRSNEQRTADRQAFEATWEVLKTGASPRTTEIQLSLIE